MSSGRIPSRIGRVEKKGKTQEKMERGSRKRSSSAGSERMDRVGGREEKMEGHCSTGQSPTVGCIANGRRRRRRIPRNILPSVGHTRVITMNTLFVWRKRKVAAEIYSYLVSLYGKNRKIQINVL